MVRVHAKLNRSQSGSSYLDLGFIQVRTRIIGTPFVQFYPQCLNPGASAQAPNSKHLWEVPALERLAGTG